VGVTTDLNYEFNEFAGYKGQSIAYHADDGKVYIKGKPLDGFQGPKYGTQDVIGCGITGQGHIYFTFNGVPLPLIDCKFKGNIYPLVSLRGAFT
jgi:hypothetical protein